MTKLQQIVWDWEKEISDLDEIANLYKEDILKLKSIGDVKSYYLNDREWCGDKSFTWILFDLIEKLGRARV